MARRRTFGSVRRLPSRRWQARYTGPDKRTHTAPLTFDTKGDAEAWLSLRQSEILRDTWLPPGRPRSAPTTFGGYSTSWLATRPLKPRTRAHYRDLLERWILPTFGDVPIGAVTPAAVRSWHAALFVGPTAKAHAYGLLRTIYATAVSDDLVAANPCRIRGAGQAKRVKKIRPATLDELEAIVAELPERYRLMALLAAWCGLRFGETAELRRKDVDTTSGVIHVRRAVVVTKATGVVVGAPKSAAGVRDVAIPPHLLPVVEMHLARNMPIGPEALLFPARTGGHMQPSSLFKVWKRARAIAGRDDLRWHDLRHTGAVLAAATGATLAELMARLGHSTPAAAMRYQHAAADRDKVIADALSKFADGTVSPIREPRTG